MKKKTQDNETGPEFLQSLKANLKGVPFDTLTSYKDFFVSGDKVPTGSVIFDIYLDGGFRCGVSRFIGEAEHGKTANALQWAKNWLETIDNSFVLYINSEGRLTKELISKSGINTSEDRFCVWTHNVYEDIAEAISELIYNNDSKVRYFFVIDSLDAVVTKDDIEKKMGDSKTVAGGARLGSFFLKKTSVRIGARGHHLMLLSQTRMKMNSRGVGMVSTTASGGKAVEFFSSLTGQIQVIYPGLQGSLIYEDRNNPKSKPIGHYFTVLFKKTFHERTHERIGIPIKYGHGVWHEQECLDLCLAYQYIRKSGAGWYEFSDSILEILEKHGGCGDEEMIKKHHGEQKVIDFLENSPKITKIILDYIKEMCIESKSTLSETVREDDGDIFGSEDNKKGKKKLD